MAHPLSLLVAAGQGDPATLALAQARLRALLRAHRDEDGALNVRAAAAAAEPPMHETTLHDLLTRAGLRGWVAAQRAQRAEKSTSRQK
jgi:hypothetical protein